MSIAKATIYDQLGNSSPFGGTLLKAVTREAAGKDEVRHLGYTLMFKTAATERTLPPAVT